MMPDESPTGGTSPQGLRVAPRASSPSYPPAGMTWPMVAFAFVREMPYTVMVVAGCVVAVVFLYRAPTSSLEPLAAVIVPAIVSALGRSRPPEAGQLGVLALVWAKWKGWTA